MVLLLKFLVVLQYFVITKTAPSRCKHYCPSKFSSINKNHTMCKKGAALPNLEPGVGSMDKITIATMHNDIRRTVLPPATNMREMTYDTAIGLSAQKLADCCTIGKHDTPIDRYDYGRYTVGQNAFWHAGGVKNWTNVISGWASEGTIFKYNGDNTGNLVGHYVQMVCAETTRVGCGHALCNKTDNETGETYVVHNYVCNYAPACNTVSELPYKAGDVEADRCSDCRTSCNNSLCDCGGKICYNSGTMNPDTCTCSCLPLFQMPNCQLNCTIMRDNAQCGQDDWKLERSLYDPQMFVVCPYMCGLCPNAGVHFMKTYNRRT